MATPVGPSRKKTVTKKAVNKRVARKVAARKGIITKKIIEPKQKIILDEEVDQVSRLNTKPTHTISEEKVANKENIYAGAMRGTQQPLKPKKTHRVILFFLIGILVGALGTHVITNKINNKTLVEVDTVQTSNLFNKAFIEENILATIPENPTDFKDVDLSTFWEVWRILEKHHVPTPSDNNIKKIDRPNREEFLQSAIDGLTFATRDRYTNFLSSDVASEFTKEIINGEIQGIGAYIGKPKGILTVIRPIENGPAAKAGLQKGDIILKINDEKVDTLNLLESTNKIKGLKGTIVKLTIYRVTSDKKLTISVKRDRVVVPSVETEIQDNIFIIRLLNINKKTALAFRNALQEFAKNKKTDRILLDMRGNPGGILEVGIYITGLFLPKGSVVLYEYDGKSASRRYRTITGPILGDTQPPMVILVDSGTASAAEIIAAALVHYNIATIVGVPTLGKGSVQSLEKVLGDGLLKITTAHWLTPSKKSISEDGIKPTVDITEIRREYIRKAEENKLDIDEYELQEAIKVLQNK